MRTHESSPCGVRCEHGNPCTVVAVDGDTRALPGPLGGDERQTITEHRKEGAHLSFDGDKPHVWRKV